VTVTHLLKGTAKRLMLCETVCDSKFQCPLCGQTRYNYISEAGSLPVFKLKTFILFGPLDKAWRQGATLFNRCHGAGTHCLCLKTNTHTQHSAMNSLHKIVP
jgi:hypothetical protein